MSLYVRSFLSSHFFILKLHDLFYVTFMKLQRLFNVT